MLQMIQMIINIMLSGAIIRVPTQRLEILVELAYKIVIIKSFAQSIGPAQAVIPVMSMVVK